MYIAIEGIKGCGKSTLINLLKVQDFFAQEKLLHFPITKELPFNHPAEITHSKQSELIRDDRFAEYLFAQRADWHFRNIPDWRNMIIGDRSLATAYVTRWRKWNDPYYTIERTDMMHKSIPKPNVIIWLNTPVFSTYQQIQKRPQKKWGQNEEQLNSLSEANEIYQELFQYGLYQKKIDKGEIITLNGLHPISETTKEIKSIIKHYQQL